MRCCELSLAREQSLRALETLIGRYPDANVEIAQELAQLPGPVPAGLPSELLERRPDVVAADRRVAAAFYRSRGSPGRAAADDFVDRNVNSVSSELFVLQDRDNPVWSAGASLLAPLFTGRASEIAGRDTYRRAAAGDRGVRPGRRARVRRSRECARRRDRGRPARGSADPRGGRRIRKPSRSRKFATTSAPATCASVQQQQTAVHGSRAALVRVQTDQLVQRVNLYLALGGGFEVPPPAVASAE